MFKFFFVGKRRSLGKRVLYSQSHQAEYVEPGRQRVQCIAVCVEQLDTQLRGSAVGNKKFLESNKDHSWERRAVPGATIDYCAFYTVMHWSISIRPSICPVAGVMTISPHFSPLFLPAFRSWASSLGYPMRKKTKHDSSQTTLLCIYL